MAKLHQRVRSNPRSAEFTDHYIRDTVDGGIVTYQVPKEARIAILARYPKLQLWRLPDGGVELDKAFVVELREKKLLKTKQELETEMRRFGWPRRQRRC